MHFARALFAAGFLLSATLAAPLLPIKVHDLSARDYDVDKSEYAARSWLDEDGVMAARDLSDFLEDLNTRDEDYEVDLVARDRAAEFEKVKSQIIANGLKTPPDKAVFWTGSTPRPNKDPLSAKEAAGRYARKIKGMTVQMKLNKENIRMLNYDIKDLNDYSGQLWKLASRLFAQGASGEIHAFLGQNVKENGVYMVVEKPELINNPAVTALIEHVKGQPNLRYVKGRATRGKRRK
ncbi:hypothetical protein BKA70DRAFT_1568377 [Coprinopsis sp. MPI-PUGE-AT-0042]|nr:hypothetical protein BKA70DRAFT_1568377 [Coprinopsis sp. MPI-PUGE-AT-0042]